MFRFGYAFITNEKRSSFKRHGMGSPSCFFVSVVIWFVCLFVSCFHQWPLRGRISRIPQNHSRNICLSSIRHFIDLDPLDTIGFVFDTFYFVVSLLFSKIKLDVCSTNIDGCAFRNSWIGWWRCLIRRTLGEPSGSKIIPAVIATNPRTAQIRGGKCDGRHHCSPPQTRHF